MVAASVPIPSYPDTSRVLRGRDMLCFGHDWSGDPLSKTHLMRLLARDNRILWINSIGYRAPTASARDLRPHRQQAQGRRRAGARRSSPTSSSSTRSPSRRTASPGCATVNRELLSSRCGGRWTGSASAASSTGSSTPRAAVVAGALGEDLVVYYCVDEFTAFTGIPPQLVELERQLIRKADLVIVSSEKLRRTQVGATTRAPRWCATASTSTTSARRSRPRPGSRTTSPSLPRPVIGYFGLMAEDWIDIDLMVHVARHFSARLDGAARQGDDRHLAPHRAAQRPPPRPQAVRRRCRRTARASTSPSTRSPSTR